MRFIDPVYRCTFRQCLLFGMAAGLTFALAPATFGQESGGHDHGANAATPHADEMGGDVYTLDTCPVSGEVLDTMDNPVTKQIDGREVRFCCPMCVGKFEADKETYFKKIDTKLIEQQLPYYPVTRCVVSGERLVDDSEDGEDEVINFIYKNRLVRFCCEMCIESFQQDPTKYLHKLDTAVIEKQRKRYPLDTCPVSGEALDVMGEPFEMIVGNRLVKLCCKMCTKKFEKDPARYLKMIDDAWKPILSEHALTTGTAPETEPGGDHNRRDGGAGAGAKSGHDHDHGADGGTHGNDRPTA